MRGSELESITATYLLERARQMLVQQQRLAPEKAEEYLYQLAQARKLFLADAAAEVIAAGTPTSFSQSAFPGSTDWSETPGGHEAQGGCEGVDWELVCVPYWGTLRTPV